MSIQREVERIDVRGDDGFATTIIGMQAFETVSPFQQGDQLVPGMIDFRTVDGEHCNQINEDEFVILGDGVHPDKTVRRVK